MRQTLVAAKSKGTNQWLARQMADPFVRGRQSASFAFRSRAAFKLLELESKFKMFRGSPVVVDLGSAPGGWSQVVASKLGWFAKPNNAIMREQAEKTVLDSIYGNSSSWSDEIDPKATPENIKCGRGTIIAVDLLHMPPIPGVNFIQGDFLEPTVQEAVRMLIPPSKRFFPERRLVDVIISDMGANMSGNRIADSQGSLDLCTAALQFACRNLQPFDRKHQQWGGTLVMKHFQHPLLTDFRKKELEPRFRQITYVKPDSSRSESSEGYWVCQEFQGGPYTPVFGPPGSGDPATEGLTNLQIRKKRLKLRGRRKLKSRLLEEFQKAGKAGKPMDATLWRRWKAYMKFSKKESDVPETSNNDKTGT